MKALVYTGPETLAYQDAPDPIPAADDVLVRVEAVGICGSDMHAFLGHDDRRPAPLILGHEAAGVIETGPRAGERVTVNPLATCGLCPACLAGRENICPERRILSMPPREGAFAQYVTTPEANLVTVPDAVSFDAASLAEPIACGWHAARIGLTQTGGVDEALVIGGGTIGLGAALSLRAQGVASVVIVEPHPGRRRFLIDQCGETAVAPDDLGPSAMFALVVDAVGYAATRAAASARARPGGAILHIGLGSADGGVDVRRLTLQEISFTGTYTYTAQDFRDTAAAMFDGRLGALDWTDSRPLADGAQAFTDIRQGAVAAPKIILKPYETGATHV